MHHDPIAGLVLALALILAAAKLLGHLAVRLRQPAVLGELCAGVLLGNAHLVGLDVFAPLLREPTLDMLARLGALLLLFEVGLHSSVGQMRKVGAQALLVAVVGVIAPLLLGIGVGALALGHASFYTQLFLGAALCATSVGVTARVLQDLGAHGSLEARIILGAAVIDDVFALIVLAVVAGLIAAVNSGGGMAVSDGVLIVCKCAGFLLGALALGVLVAPRVFRAASYLRSGGVLLATGLSLCFVLAWAADAIGLSAIVGAFAAGLILEEVHAKDFAERGEQSLAALVAPVASMLVPVFFVMMGTHMDLRAFADPSVISLAALLIAAAVLGKQACALAVTKVDGVRPDRLTIGIGMIPRGEVGLIFASVGAGLSIDSVPILSADVWSAIVIMVIVTTMITPPLLRFSLARSAARG